MYLAFASHMCAFACAGFREFFARSHCPAYSLWATDKIRSSLQALADITALKVRRSRTACCSEHFEGVCAARPSCRRPHAGPIASRQTAHPVRGGTKVRFHHIKMDEMVGPIFLFPSCAAAVLDFLCARDAYRAGCVSARWRGASATTMHARHIRLGCVGAAQSAQTRDLTTHATMSDVGTALRALRQSLTWRPQGCLILTTEESVARSHARTDVPNNPRRRNRGRRSSRSVSAIETLLEREVAAYLPPDCVVVVASSEGVFGPDGNELRELCEAEGAAVMVFRSDRPPALLGLKARKPGESLVLRGAPTTPRWPSGRSNSHAHSARKFVDRWLEALGTSNGLHLVLSSGASVARAVLDGALGSGRYGKCVGGLVAGKAAMLLAGRPADLQSVDIAVLTVAFDGTHSHACTDSPPRRSHPMPYNPCVRPSWGLLVTCVAFNNFANVDDADGPAPSQNIESVKKIFGSDAPPVIGFLAHGEIGPDVNANLDAAMPVKYSMQSYTAFLAIVGARPHAT